MQSPVWWPYIDSGKRMRCACLPDTPLLSSALQRALPRGTCCKSVRLLELAFDCLALSISQIWRLSPNHKDKAF